MKTGEIKRLYLDGKSDCVAMLMPDGTYLTDHGKILSIREDEIIEEKSVRLSKEQRSLFKEVFSVSVSYYKLQEAIDTLKKEQEIYRSEIYTKASFLERLNPNCSKKVFTNIVWMSLPNAIREKLEAYDFHLSILPEGSFAHNPTENAIYLHREIVIERHVRSSDYTFLYEKYDSSLALTNNHKDCNDYKELLKKNTVNINIDGCRKKAKIGIGLSRDSLRVEQVFYIKIPKSLKKDGAKELGKQLIERISFPDE